MFVDVTSAVLPHYSRDNAQLVIRAKNFDETGRWGIANIVAGCAHVSAFISLVHRPQPNESRRLVDFNTIITLQQLTIL